MNLEANIRWADAFILMYSVTDKCSFDECNRLKFLINYNKRRKKIGSNYKVRFHVHCARMFELNFIETVLPIFQDGNFDVPVILVANKIDQYGDRMVSVEEGQRRFREISCACFHEISVRESIEQVCLLISQIDWEKNGTAQQMQKSISRFPFTRCGVYFAMCVAFGVFSLNSQN